MWQKEAGPINNTVLTWLQNIISDQSNMNSQHMRLRGQHQRFTMACETDQRRINRPALSSTAHTAILVRQENLFVTQLVLQSCCHAQVYHCLNNRVSLATLLLVLVCSQQLLYGLLAALLHCARNALSVSPMTSATMSSMLSCRTCRPLNCLGASQGQLQDQVEQKECPQAALRLFEGSNDWQCFSWIERHHAACQALCPCCLLTLGRQHSCQSPGALSVMQMAMGQMLAAPAIVVSWLAHSPAHKQTRITSMVAASGTRGPDPFLLTATLPSST